MDSVQRPALVLDRGTEHNSQVATLALLDRLHLASGEVMLDHLILGHGLIQLVNESLQAGSCAEALVQPISPLRLGLLAGNLQAHGAPCGYHLPHLAKHLHSISDYRVGHFHEFRGTPEVLQHRIEVVVRDVHVVVGRPQLLRVILLGAAELSANVLVHLASHLPLLGLGLLEVEPCPVVLHSLVIHALHRGLQVHIPPKPLQQALPIPHEHRVHRRPRLLQHLRPHGLHGDHHLVDQVVRVARAEERPGEVGDEGVEVVVVDVEVPVDLSQGPSLVGLGPSQQLNQVDRSPGLHFLQAVSNQLLDPRVRLGDVKPHLHEARDALRGSQALEELVLALLHILTGHLHAHGVASGDVSTDGLQDGNGVLRVPGLDSHLLEGCGKDIQQTVKMVVR
mmetsp:Transcript_79182/g.211687  ORF Transcript_79182/g.211687 Transcript_79182/m.211687 type:complete len:394 (-) Transcript_79182:291-1472(-)